jgi:hypothetical protein
LSSDFYFYQEPKQGKCDKTNTMVAPYKMQAATTINSANTCVRSKRNNQCYFRGKKIHLVGLEH